jgi:hypothetical protein
MIDLISDRNCAAVILLFVRSLSACCCRVADSSEGYLDCVV